MRLIPLHNLLNKWIKQKVSYTWLHSLIAAVLFFGSLYISPYQLKCTVEMLLTLE
ncbi:hypothetical protein [Enterococcus durans]|uniref:hypothetical protein n=1 Tax=Enterococcus durans TaxID=53345 RepID=UPI00232DC84D|nr:hypothetical protein [Enterococcus durans]